MERHLYVPSEAISFESQVAHAHKLIKHVETVWVHRHPYGVTCPQDDQCLRIGLREGDAESTLVPGSQLEEQS